MVACRSISGKMYYIFMARLMQSHRHLDGSMKAGPTQ